MFLMIMGFKGPDFSLWEDRTNDYRYNDVEEKIILKIIEMIEDADKASNLIDWIKLRNFIIEKGMDHPPNLFTVPIPVIERCLNKARDRANYMDNLNRPEHLIKNHDNLNDKELPYEL